MEIDFIDAHIVCTAELNLDGYIIGSCVCSLRAEPGSCEERDPFLPGRGSRGGTLTSLGGPGYSRPRHSHTPPQTPPFPGTL